MSRRRPLAMRLKDEEGVAMITAILVSVIVISLSAVAIQLALHNVGTSAYDRKRVQAVAAAEAGIDATMEQLQTAQAQSNGTLNLPCSYVPGSALAFQSTPISLQMAPGAQYQVAVGFVDQNGAGLSCTSVQSGAVTPSSAYITSTGVATATSSSIAVSRTLYTQVTLIPNTGFTQALFSNGQFSSQNQFTITGYNSNNGNIYTNGDFVCNNNSTVYGSVYAQGGATIGSSCTMAQDLWTGSSISMSNTAEVKGNLTSSTGGLTLQNSAKIDGNVKVNGTCTDNGTACAAPSSYIGGTLATGSASPLPPKYPFPALEWATGSPSDFKPGYQALGYTVYNATSTPSVTCANAATAIATGFTPPASSPGAIVDVSPTVCPIQFGNNAVVNVNTNTTIVVNGSFTTNNLVTFSGTAGACPQNKTLPTNPIANGNCILAVIVPSSSVPGFTRATPCPSPFNTTGTYDISFSQQTVFKNLEVFFYTPCNVNAQNNQGMAGQVYAGGAAQIGNQFQLAYVPIPFPTASTEIVGYQVSPVFLREVPVVHP
jgi:hypothetical protein